MLRSPRCRQRLEEGNFVPWDIDAISQLIDFPRPAIRIATSVRQSFNSKFVECLSVVHSEIDFNYEYFCHIINSDSIVLHVLDTFNTTNEKSNRRHGRLHEVSPQSVKLIPRDGVSFVKKKNRRTPRLMVSTDPLDAK